MGKIKLLERIYFNPKHPASFGGIDKLYQAVKPKFSKQEVKDWLSGQESFTLHKNVRHTFKRNRIQVSTLGEQFQADLNDMRHLARYNDHYNYILTVIDVFSRYAWAFPLKNKTPEEVIRVFKLIFKESVPLKIQTDKGGEFFNAKVKRFLATQHITLFSTHDDVVKAAMVERLNRTLKVRMHRYFTHANSRRYLDVLPSLMHSYNHTKHSAIHMAPADVNEYNTLKVWHQLHPKTFTKKAALSVGDHVRISRTKMRFEKGYEANFSRELFIITRVLRPSQPLYRIKDLNGEPIKGTFYQDQLQKVTRPETYHIEKVLKKRTVHRKRQLFVKWLGYSDTFNSWINEKDVVLPRVTQ